MADDDRQLGRPRDPSRDAAILAATLDLLGEVGYEQVTVRAIAERAGVGLATMYRRWPTKEELVVDAVASFEDPTERLRPGQDPVDNLLRLVSGLLEVLQGPRQGLISNVIGQLHDNPVLAETLRRKVVSPRLAAVTEQLAAVPGVRPDQVSMAAELIPALVFFRTLVLDRPVSKRDAPRLVRAAILAATATTDATDGITRAGVRGARRPRPSRR